MTDKQFKEQKKRVEKLVPIWRDKLGLNSYRLHNSYSRENKKEAWGYYFFNLSLR